MNWSESGENYEKTKTHRNKIGFDSDFCDRRIVSIQNRQTDEQEEKMNESRIHSNGMNIPMKVAIWGALYFYQILNIISHMHANLYIL